MASTSKKTSSKSSGRKRKASTNTSRKTRTKKDYELLLEIRIVLVFALSIFLCICNFGIIGNVGNALSNVLFGLFGLVAYVAPILLGLLVIFIMLNGGISEAVKKAISGSGLVLAIMMILDLVCGLSISFEKYDFSSLWLRGYKEHLGGGILAASIVYFLNKCIDLVGTIIVISVLFVVSLIIFTNKSFFGLVKNAKGKVIERSIEDKEFKLELQNERRIEHEEKRRIKDEERRAKEEEQKNRRAINKQVKEDEKILRKSKKVTGVTKDTSLYEEVPVNNTKLSFNDMHEITLNGFDPNEGILYEDAVIEENIIDQNIVESSEVIQEFDYSSLNSYEKEEPVIVKPSEPVRPKATPKNENITSVNISSSNKISGQYQFPPISLLTKGSRKSSGDSAQEIRDTARKLQETLAIFGVEATVTDISQGPTVTRFELQPKLGTKVSRIKSLSDDIKLNLAAADIRIEAPIPGKAAIGIEVPNKENQPVLFRDLIENDEFSKFNSGLAFSVGKDISGKNIIYDIDKFPHLLIAGATGSGKSVCINTLIMSILYKAHPDDVKLIMIDPKVVELSVYNGIPHLLLPVVTDAKKAAATLNYAVNEMMERYKKFADMNTRDLAGYNRAVLEKGESELYKKLPQIVIIVDELADLIMVAKSDVEDAICRLAQLARAAGIHLIIATQRPSVDVITGLIKANMPSRIAFAVSSNTDSRTILDMGGAEELLGKGDMLFFPKGLKKPVRLQGGYVSDEEVNNVVDFLKSNTSIEYDTNVEQMINTISTQSGSSSSGADGASDGYDDMFIEAGRFIIETNKASIGMLQRKFKMGFNRAARVMDQLSEAGVVGPDEGTKPRQILMGPEQFENFIENEM